MFRALAQVEPAREAADIVRVRAEFAGAHVEQVLRARFAVGHAAAEAVGHADQADLGIRRCMPHELGGQGAAAEAGTDDGDAHALLLRPLEDQ